MTLVITELGDPCTADNCWSCAELVRDHPESEIVRVVSGGFGGMLAVVDKRDRAKGKVNVAVSIFGRETPVELDFLQVERL